MSLFEETFFASAFEFRGIIFYPRGTSKLLLKHERHHRDKGYFDITWFNEAVTASKTNKLESSYITEMLILEWIKEDIPEMTRLINYHLKYGEADTLYAVYLTLVQNYGLMGFYELMTLSPDQYKPEQSLKLTKRQKKSYIQTERYPYQLRLEMYKHYESLKNGREFTMPRSRKYYMTRDLQWMCSCINELLYTDIDNSFKQKIIERYIKIYERHSELFANYNFIELFEIGNKISVLGAKVESRGDLSFIKGMNFYLQNYLKNFVNNAGYRVGYALVLKDNLQQLTNLHGQLYDVFINFGMDDEYSTKVLRRFWAGLLHKIPIQFAPHQETNSPNFTQFKERLDDEQRMFFTLVSDIDLSV